MANDLNLCQFIGRLGSDPETRHLQSGSQVTNFSIAVGSSWRDKSTGEKVERTEWVKVDTWSKLAEICAQYLTKGSQVYIAGEMKTRRWEDKNGEPHYSTSVTARQMQMLGGKRDGAKQQQSQAQPAAESFDDDIPF